VPWDLWIDYHGIDVDGLTHASVRNVSPGVKLAPGMFVIVGNEDAESAVAEVASIDERGIVLVRVLAGPAEDHLHLLRRDPPTPD
jgi:hypothetical protein